MAWNWKKMNAAKKRLIRRAAVSFVVYEVLWCGTFFWVDRAKLSGQVLLLMAALPTFPLVGLIVSMGKYLGEEVDGFHKELVVRCLLWGTAAVMTSVGFHIFLQLFGWKGNWPAVIELVVFMVAMGAAKLTYRAQHRVPEDADAVLGRGEAQ